VKVIGAGFGRTGTASQQAALVTLGFKPCYHFLEIFSHPDHARVWERAVAFPEAKFILDNVQRTIPADRLLVFDLEDGWEPLCKFLDVPVPPGMPFPHLNDTATFQARSEALRAGHR
jgi:Sulfotransferase domain